MAVTNYVNTITPDQAEKLRHILEHEDFWDIDDAPHAVFRARKNKTTCVVYLSGKLVVQGKGTEEMVQFILEPRILGEARLGYEGIHAREENPEMFEPHAGLDESGKGDYFGPLITACCYTNEDSTSELFDLGVQDSKNIKSDKKIRDLADKIRDALRGRYAVVRIGPAAYNRMYQRASNVNRMLAWGHARALENLLEKAPDCPRFLVDQFARNPKTMTGALMERGKAIIFEQRVRAEDDIAVAAASILARAEFIDQMDKLSEQAGVELPRGASRAVLEAAADIVKKKGEAELENYAKLHFRTTKKAVALANGIELSDSDIDGE